MRISANLVTALLVLGIILISKFIRGLPWWGFVIPLVVLGMVMTWKRVGASYFTIGFLTGFLVWIGGSLFFHFRFNGIFLGQFKPVIQIILLIVAGIIGGIVTGLALYVGHSFAYDKKKEIKL